MITVAWLFPAFFVGLVCGILFCEEVKKRFGK